MANVLTAENVDVSKVMAAEGMQDAADKVLQELEANPVTQKLMETAQTVEDMFQIVKNYAKVKLEEFKVIWDKTVNYFKEEKAALADEMLDNVVGGWSFSSFWNKWKKPILAAAIVVGCTVAGVVVGAATAGLGGAAIGAAVGAGIGALAAYVYVDSTNRHERGER